MRHIEPVTVARAVATGGKIDPAGAVFLQVWAAVMSWILLGAFGKE